MGDKSKSLRVVEASRLREKYITQFIAKLFVARDAIEVAVSY